MISTPKNIDKIAYTLFHTNSKSGVCLILIVRLNLNFPPFKYSITTSS